jgi:tetratricopeptide (TPR) repeat protein
VKKTDIFYLFFILFFLITGTSYAITGSSDRPMKLTADELPWRILQQAQICFNDGNYADAFMYAQQATENRKRECDWMLYVLNKELKPVEVQKAGDSLSAITVLLKKRESNDALDILKSVYNKKNIDYFNDSKQKVFEYIQSQYNYPEADFLIGRIYRVEGEYSIAEKYYMRALEHSDALSIPNQKYDILYELAHLSEVQQNHDAYEKYLLLIVSGDQLYTDKTMLSAMKRTLRNKMNGILDKFFLMYRDKNIISMDAFFKLAELYRERNDTEAALMASAYGVINAFTHIYTIMLQRDPNFEYTDFSTFLAEMLKYRDIQEWVQSKNIWQEFADFADTARQYNCPSFAGELSAALEKSVSDQNLRKQLQSKLQPTVNQ